MFIPELSIIPTELPSEMTRTVLIADDDSNIRDLLQIILQREGYEVHIGPVTVYTLGGP